MSVIDVSAREPTPRHRCTGGELQLRPHVLRRTSSAISLNIRILLDKIIILHVDVFAELFTFGGLEHTGVRAKYTQLYAVEAPLMPFNCIYISHLTH